MKLAELIRDIEVREVRGSAEVEVKDLAYDASSAAPGDCFVAIKGSKRDGIEFAPDAVARGAVAVVSERPAELCGDAVNVIVENARRALGMMSARMQGDPSAEMTLVGVTGTNGKTTTTYLLESIFAAFGRSPGVIGTVEYRYAGRRIPAPHTTPQSLDLQRLLGSMRDAGCRACAMEVSSHALTQDRVAGCRFDAGIFTNLTPEHLDYHNGMEEYFAAKAILFEKILSEGGKPAAFAAINADDPYGLELARRCPVPVTLFGLKNRGDVMASNMKFDASGLRMRVETPHGSFQCRSRLCGSFNAQNILAATAAAIGLGIPLEKIAQGIEGVASVPGRFESVKNNRGLLALVDYAHTPDALDNALSHAKELVGGKGGRLIAVFGCGGDRDRKKRPLMGRAAASLADVVIVTSDNPRSESPETIIEEILPGVRESAPRFAGEIGYEVIADRREAIGRAVSIARAGDVLVVAGKGHEDYQLMGDKRLHFDDREVLAEFLKA
ncbi:MAG: UDP-N-acetylmuramoyl-L-alanyl-D-glutamate--2,6-diaminopimelate ligase [bacterium]